MKSRERLTTLEDAKRAFAPFVNEMDRLDTRPCKDCGALSVLKNNAIYCEECRDRRAAEANRLARRNRRQRDTLARREAAGVIKKSGCFLVLAANCSHCGGPFAPKRSTARYCGARCRVAAHRAKA